MDCKFADLATADEELTAAYHRDSERAVSTVAAIAVGKVGPRHSWNMAVKELGFLSLKNLKTYKVQY